MKITNRYGLPEVIVKAIEADPYSKAGSDFSVTQLINPPQLNKLLRDHGDEVTEDVTDRIWALHGQAVHAVIERAKRPGSIAEQRFFMPTEYGVLSGQIDLFNIEQELLTDFKVTSVYKIKRAIEEPPFEWEVQLNMQAQLMRHSGIWPMHLEIVAIARDWSKSAAMRDAGYPAKVVAIPIKMWSEQEAHDYINERIELHWRVMQKGHEMDCTDEERWKRNDQYAVMRKGQKRALRLLNSMEEVRQYLLDHNLAEPGEDKPKLADGISVEVRPGAYVRCEDYCPVSAFCKQYMRIEEDA